MKKITILVSGKGTNLKHIVRSIHNGTLSTFSINSVISDRICPAIFYALKKNIKIFSLKKDQFLSKKIDNILLNNIPYMIVLSGFLSFLDEEFCKKWERKIINVHPSLLPKYGGKGMYGMNVHRSVIKNKECISGATIHYVTKHIDEGKILLQKSCKVSIKDNPISLSKKVSIIEKEILIQSIKNF
ncbi:formyltransferase family protein [Blattabacterium cuenoti]|uniref:formyltransferase family protein n=1 Tax=Blattabacterium cuenoti TaxID=1653831 RepID=UPI00163BC949|nr:formyltransferase family protein [Blattabacterium cuenoti]